jgi:hypothetical protein
MDVRFTPAGPPAATRRRTAPVSDQGLTVLDLGGGPEGV